MSYYLGSSVAIAFRVVIPAVCDPIPPILPNLVHVPILHPRRSDGGDGGDRWMQLHKGKTHIRAPSNIYYVRAAGVAGRVRYP